MHRIGRTIYHKIRRFSTRFSIYFPNRTIFSLLYKTLYAEPVFFRLLYSIPLPHKLNWVTIHVLTVCSFIEVCVSSILHTHTHTKVTWMAVKGYSNRCMLNTSMNEHSLSQKMIFWTDKVLKTDQTHFYVSRNQYLIRINRCNMLKSLKYFFDNHFFVS